MTAALLRPMAALALSAAIAPGAVAATDLLHWTIRDEVEVPVVTQTAVSDDGSIGFAVVRRDTLAKNSREFRLIKVDLKTHKMKTVLCARWISGLAQVPATKDWSVLADLGRGVQLYRMAQDHRIAPIVIRSSTVEIGTDPGVAITQSDFEFDQAFGVFDYGWSPDGRYFWYSTAHRLPKMPARPEVVVTPSVPYAVFRAHVSELHLVSPGKFDRVVATAAGESVPHTVVFYQNGAAFWDQRLQPSGAFGLNFQVQSPGGGSVQSVWRRIDPTTGAMSLGDEPRPDVAVGAGGGRLRQVDVEGQKHLIEALPDGSSRDYGPTDFDISSYWSHKNWGFPAAGVAVQAVRHQGADQRSDLVRLSQDGRLVPLEREVSLTNCAMAVKAAQGLCVREGWNTPPEIVAIDVKVWTETPIGPVAPEFANLEPFKIVPRAWTANGLTSNGFVIYPRGFAPGGRYPAIVVTHGSDGDNRFAKWDLQWSYPLQVWAERGFVVIVVNDIPAPVPSERWDAYMQWASGKGSLAPQRVLQLIWLDQLKIYRQVISELGDEGAIDPARVGIAGYSRGSQMATVAVANSDLFAAASSGDGSYFAPSSYWIADNRTSYGMLFGGAPANPSAFKEWAAIAPAFRASQVRAAVLFQVATDKAGMQDFFGALREAGVPSEFVNFGDETHLFHYPANRAIAMQQNLDWFDFWLKGSEDPAPTKLEQYLRWRSMRIDSRAGTQSQRR